MNEEVQRSEAWSLLFRAARWMSTLVVMLLSALITGYQRIVSPLLGPCCRFSPSCSCYAKETLEKDGLVKGLAKTAWRLARCHPFCKGGYDPP